MGLFFSNVVWFIFTFMIYKLLKILVEMLLEVCQNHTKVENHVNCVQTIVVTSNFLFC